MAQSQINQTIGIRVDQGKLDADIRLARAKMQQLAKDANAAAKESLKTGDRTAADAASRAFTQQEQALRGLTNQKKAYVAATRVSTEAVHKEAAAYREFTKYIIEFGKEAGISNLSVRGLKLGLAGLVVAEAVKGIVEAVKAVNELQSAAHEAGTDPASLAGLRNMFRAAGLEAKNADPMMAKFTKTLRESRLAAADTRKIFSEALAEPGVTSAEASERLNKAEAERRKTDPFEAAGLHAENYAQTVQGSNQALQDVAKAANQMKKEGRLDEAVRLADRFGISLERDEQVLNQIATTGVAQAIVPDEAGMAKLREANQIYANIAESARQVQQSVGIGAAGALAGAAKASTYQQGFEGLATTGGGFAGGGYIRGAGSGTSDSILARLSNGEYVVNAASVRRLGVGYLDGLNATRFAAGGLVSAASSSGRPVHLHLGGSSFALSGSSGVVDALVSHAHSQQVRSAGVKPSWFAGRPSGR